jgi:hypothetical protein
MYTGMEINLQKITAREKEIADAIKALQRESEDLAAARRVFERFTGASGNLEKQLDRAPRPQGAPSTFDMVKAVLSEAASRGTPSLSSKELIDGVRNRFWPGLTTQQILPTIYGFKKAERLEKKKGRWSLP